MAELTLHTRDILPLSIRELRYEVAQRSILDGLNLDLSDDGITAILGPNGAGKSVLLRVLCGLLTPTGGKIEFAHTASPQRQVTMVFQKPMILRTSVLDNVALALKPRGIGRHQRRELAAEYLDRVGLLDRAQDAARHLSGGEAQRLALARAWLTRPRLLLLDEPTASLDPSATAEVERIVRQIRTDGTRILMVTHNLGQATRMADDIAFMSAGRIWEHTPTQSFFRQPGSEAARRFIQGELPWRMAI